MRLRPLRDDEFDAFYAESKRGYVESLEIHGGWSADAARSKGDADMKQLFPGGLPAEGQNVFVIENDAGADIGKVWFAWPSSEEGVAFLYDIHLTRGERSRGYGREAMQQLEQLVRERGAKQIALNVFGGNEIARRLYRALGYAERAVFMSKEL